MATNLQIKFIKSLQLKKNRVEHKQYVCEGTKIVDELIRFNSKNIISIFANQSWIDLNHNVNLNSELVSDKELEKMSGLNSAPDVIAIVKTFDHIANYDLRPISLYLDQINDPGNLGTIIRTADWFGLDRIFISPKSVDLYNSKVIQSTMGSFFRVKIMEIEFKDLIAKIPFSQIYTAEMRGSLLNQIKFESNALLVMGSESHGVSNYIQELATQKMTIPSYGQAESLNVAVATGIILNHFVSK